MADMNVNGVQSQVHLNDTSSVNKTKETEETSLFGFIDKAEIDATTVLSGLIDELVGDGAFTKEEAETYVNAEIEIEELIKSTPKKQSLIDLILDPGKHEREIREKYEKEHPEYAAVKKEGDNVQKDYDDAFAKAKEEWLKDNPAPKKVLEEGGKLGVTIPEETREWISKEIDFEQNFEEEYIQNNPDYANLKDERDKHKSLTEKLIDAFL